MLFCRFFLEKMKCLFYDMFCIFFFGFVSCWLFFGSFEVILVYFVFGCFGVVVVLFFFIIFIFLKGFECLEWCLNLFVDF